MNGDGGLVPAGADGARTIGDVVAGALAGLGVRRVHGLPLGGLAHVPVADWDLAVLLADVDGRLGEPGGGGRVGAALLPGPVLHLSSRPGGRAPLQTVGSLDELLDVLVTAPGVELPATTALHLDLDLAAPAPAEVAAPSRDDRRPVLTLDPALSGLRLLVVAGPGVVRSRAGAGLRSLSRAASAPVLASWGAAGLERWDSPYHAGTAGLQERDLELGGASAADVVLASGLDPDELDVAALERVPVQEVPPNQLGALCQAWPARDEAPAGRPSVRAALAPVLTPGYESTGVPLHPARASLHLSGALPGDGVAVADAGAAGFWVARTFPASVPGSFLVPATAEPGVAAAAAVVAALDGRPCLAVTDDAGAADPVTGALLELAGSLGLGVALQVWSPDGPAFTPDGHVALLADHLAPHRVRVDRVGVDLALPQDLIALAGPVVAWEGPAAGVP